MDLISTLAEADFEEQYEAKVISLDALYRTLYSKELDFCLVVSSISSVLGGLRFGAYAPVNAAIDSYIAFLKDQDKADNWFYVDFDGLAFDDVQGEGVRTGELFTIFERLIALRELPGVIVSVGDLNKRWEKAVLFQNNIHYKASLPEPGQAMDGALDIVEQMTRLWQEFFGFDTIKVTDDFFELGGDSLKALTVIGRIQKRLHIDLSVTEFFNNSTIKKLSDHIRLVHLAEDEASDAPASLPMAERKAYYSLSSVQRRLHFLYEVDSQSIAYNQPLLLRLEGKPDISRLETVIGQLIRRHESLRTSFEIVNEQAEQRVLDEFAFKLEYYTATGNEKEIIKDFIRPFDLKAAPLFRGALISVSPDVHILAVDSHHIVMDRVSEALLLRDFSSLYANEQLPDLHFQYKDYAEWQQSDKQRAEMTAHKDFWIREFAEGAASPELPADYPRPAVKSYQGDLVSFELDAERTAALQKIAESEGATVFMLFLSLYSILLAKICNQEDIIIGAPISGRSHADLENITGMFVNTLPLRTYPKGELTYTAFLAQVKEKFLVSLDNQSYPYEALIDELKMERSANRNPLVDVWFAYEQDDRPAVVIPGLAITRYDYDHVVAKFDLGLLVSETGNSTRFTFEYPTELFKRETVEAFTAAFARIIESVIEDKTKRIAGIGILSADEKERLTYGYNNTKTEYPGDKTIIDLFGEQVRKTPENIACIAGDQTFSYRQLQERVDGIAAYLVRMKGIEPGDMVGIMLEREEYLIPCILGVLKAGGVYVPIDPGYPAERISYIIEDAKLKTLITRSKSLDASLRITCGVLNLDKEAEAVQAMPAGQPVGSKAGATAYVIYTSGSTGRPKGVMIGQRALVNYIHWAGAYYIKEERTIFPLYTSISFDLTITSIFTPLIMGRTVLLYREDGKDMLIEKVFTDRKANVIKLTPSHLKIIRDSEIVAPSGKERTIRLIVGGEDLETWLAKDIHEKFGGRVEIYNEYGPTEATVGCMIHRYSPEETLSSIPIGLPISNTQIYILDRSLAPVPVGVSGELFIAGDGLAEGYLFRPELTGEKFLDNPFIEGRKMYKTGDLACRLPDGNILFKGRMDDQIKLNGFRIELGEIEHRLLEHESIKEAVVMARERDGDKRLVAWYVAENDIGATGLRDFLGGKMPDYMLPSQFIHMSGLPLTPNGKLDRKALPEPELQSEKYTKPINEKQKEIAAIWSGILNIDEDKIGIHANFYEIGGNSIRMIKMINRVNKYFNAKISAAKMFELPTISLIADHLDKTEEEHADNILTEGEDSLEQMNETVDIINKM
jgi:amino acid adenylation domain-containing protein